MNDTSPQTGGASTPSTSAPASSGSTQSSYSSSSSASSSAPKAPTSYNPFAAREGMESPAPTASKPAGQGTEATPPPQGQQQETPATQPQAQQQSPVIQMTPELLAQVTQAQAQQFAQQQAAQTPQQRPTMSDEEFRQKFNIASVDANAYQAILGVAPERPEQVQALDQLLQSYSKQSVTIAKFMLQQEIAKLQAAQEQQLGPILQAHRAQREEALKTQFFASNKDLEGHEPLLREIVEAARLRGMSFPDAETASRFVAGKARELLGLNGQSANRQQQQAQPPAAPAVPRMPATSVGGRSNSGSVPNQGQNIAQAIFGRHDR